MHFTARGRLDRLAAWHLPSGPVGPASTWAATSSVEIRQTTYTTKRGRVVREGREGSEGQVTKRLRGHERMGWGRGPGGL